MSTGPQASGGRVLGRSVPRLEDRPLVRGQGQFVGDIAFPHQLHMRVVRSPYAHALLRGIDRSVALAAPGVVSVWTAADIADLPPDRKSTRLNSSHTVKSYAVFCLKKK